MSDLTYPARHRLLILSPLQQRVWLLAGLLLIAIIANLCLGAVDLTLTQVWQGLSAEGEQYFTVHEYRLPRIALAIGVGAMLATAGVLVQGVIRNPLASPDILGVSQGAGLAAVSLMTLWPHASIQLLPWAALAGGFSAAVLLWLVCGSKAPPIRMALTGVALAALYSSTIDFLLLTRPLDINNALLWLTGSLWGRGWQQLYTLLPWLLLLPAALWLSHRLNLMGLGDDSATCLGIRVPRVRLLALALAVGLTSAAVSLCGPISFLGLVSPHLARQLVGGRHQRLLPVAMLVGAVLLLIADLAARIIHPPIELPAGIMTALIGAPYFLWLLLKLR
ncbi:Fe(3+) dicitrate ABC transporter permease subunit FecD [Pokkaliibacter plantistimulans]|uniref:Fe(3+) dicitrate ABC transporter permease subunit FecD n=1 Tax=Pokkaliibacter plantistimulans TaxID=1635171 RepID=UPI002678615A|nr:Fe(3+) dicitrate ABC transporter permease subunit FecD [Pokkaliibacter plantistimulans]